MAIRPSITSTHSVCIYGSDESGYAYSYHDSLRDAQIQQLLEVVKLIELGWKFVGQQINGEADHPDDIRFELEKGHEVRVVALFVE